LKKSLYGLKQAPRQWYLKFDRFMTEQGYSRCHSDHCVYFKKLENGSFIILLLYVDDMLVAGTNMQDINVLKKKLSNSFAMKDLGAAKKILGMRITRDRKNRKLTLSQGEYTEKVLERFRMQNAKPVSTPLASHFKLTKEMCPKTQGGDRIHVQGPLFINSWQLDVCNGLHKTRYCTCSGSCEQVYEQSR
jgi:hypothetical protein